MPHSRRTLLRISALTVPTLLCASVACAAAERREEVETPDGGLPRDLLKLGGRATCPLCQAGLPCPDHAF